MDHAAVLQYQAGDHIQLATGLGSNAEAENGSFLPYMEKPVIISIRKDSGPLNTSTQISYNGIAQSVYGSGRTPDIEDSQLFIGDAEHAGQFGGTFGVAEIIIYNRSLTEEEENMVGTYLSEKLGLNTSYNYEPVPVPATQPIMLLLCSGLLGLVGARRKMKK